MPSFRRLCLASDGCGLPDLSLCTRGNYFGFVPFSYHLKKVARKGSELCIDHHRFLSLCQRMHEARANSVATSSVYPDQKINTYRLISITTIHGNYILDGEYIG